MSQWQVPFWVVHFLKLDFLYFWILVGAALEALRLNFLGLAFVTVLQFHLTSWLGTAGFWYWLKGTSAIFSFLLNFL
jgi:hypothetical protein